MVKHSIYIEPDLDAEIKHLARVQGKGINSVIRSRLRGNSIEASLEHLHEKLDAFFAIVELIAADLGFVAGATRAGGRNHAEIAREGGSYASSYERLTTALRPVFKSKLNEKKEV